MKRRFRLREVELQGIGATRDLAKLQAALDEIIEPEATRESVLERLQKQRETAP